MKITSFWLAIGLIVLLGFSIYANSLHSEFQYDDYVFIVENPSIYNLADVKAIWEFNAVRFVGTFTFALNYFLGGVKPFGYHLVNVFIHILSALFVWWLVRLIFLTPRVRGESTPQDRDVLALGAALLFLTHPLATTAVNHVTQRYTSLVALFYLGAVCCYAQGRLAGKVRYFIFAFVLTVLGMLTKQTAITIPLMFFVFDACFFPRQRGAGRRSVRIWLYAAMALAAGFLFIKVYGYRVPGIMSQRLVSQSHDGDIITAWNYLITQPRVIVTYLRLLCVPLHLNFDPDLPVVLSFWEPVTFFSTLFLCGLMALAVFLRRRQPLVAFGIFLVFLALSIESSILPIAYVIAEYRTYLPSVGFCLVFCVMLYSFIRNPKRFAVVLSAIIVVFSILTVQRNKVWQTEVSLWTDVIKKSPQKARPYFNLGKAYLIVKGGRPQAMEYFKKAYERDPSNSDLSYILAKVYSMQGDFPQAMIYLERTKAINPKDVRVLNGFGLFYLYQGQLQQAESFFREAYEKFPNLLEPRLNLAQVYQLENKINDAIRILEEVRKKFPHEEIAYFVLVELYFQENDFRKAVATSEEILRKVNTGRILTRTASLCAFHNYGPLALALFQKSIKVDPEDKETYLELGKLLGNRDEFDAAIRIWEAGARLDPQDPRFADLIAEAQRLKVSQRP